MSKELVSIIVSYNCLDEAVQLAQQWAEFADSQIFICENGAQPEQKIFAEVAKLSNIEVLHFPDNPGYFGAAERCMQKLKESGEPLPSWVSVSNSDLSLDKSFVSMFAKLQVGEDVGAVAPSVFSKKSCVDQNPFWEVRPSERYFRRLEWVFRSVWTGIPYILLSLFKSLIVRRLFPGSSSELGERPVYACNGCLFLLNRKYFNKGGNLKHKNFMFGEEVFVAESLRSLGLKMIYVPELKVVHEEGGTLGWWPSSRKFQWQKEASQRYPDYFK